MSHWKRANGRRWPTWPATACERRLRAASAFSEKALSVMGHGGDAYDPLTPEGRERWLTDLCTELDVTREQLGKMDLDAIFRRIRDA
jgi:hypothetical protein